MTTLTAAAIGVAIVVVILILYDLARDKRR
jgi:hypothetical protein